VKISGSRIRTHDLWIRKRVCYPLHHSASVILVRCRRINVFNQSFLLNLPATQTNRLRLVLNSAARAVIKSPKFHHINPILKPLHWLKINKRMKYKVLSLTYKFLKTGQHSYIRSLLSFPSYRRTRSSSLITLSRPSLISCLKIANRYFYHSAPVLWNNLPSHLRQVVHHVTPSPISNSPVSILSTSLFLKKLKTHLFHSSFFISLYSPRLSQD